MMRSVDWSVWSVWLNTYHDLQCRRVQASKQDLKVRVSDFVKSSAYSTYLQGLVFTGVLAAVDAGEASAGRMLPWLSRVPISHIVPCSM